MFRLSDVVCALLVLAAVAAPLGCEGPTGPEGAGSGSLSDPAVLPQVIYTYPPPNSAGPYPALYIRDCAQSWCPMLPQLQIRFNKYMDLASLGGAVNLRSTGGSIAADSLHIRSFGGDVFIVHPVDALGDWITGYLGIGDTLTLTIDTTALDVNGNRLSPPFSMTFVPEPGLRVTRTFPADGAVDVPPSAEVGLAFNSRIDGGTLASMRLNPGAGGTWVMSPDSLEASYEWLNYNGSLGSNVRYTVTIDSGAADHAGHRLPSPVGWSFTTQPFRIVATYPGDGESDVDPGSSVVVYANVPLDTSSIRSAFSIEPAVDGVLSAYPGSTSFTFQHAEPLALGVTYRVRIDTTLRSAAGATLRAPCDFGFTVRPFSVSHTTPQEGDTGVGLSWAIDIHFNAPIDTGTAAAAFSIGPPASGTLDVHPNVMSFRPYELSPVTRYTVTIDTTISAATGGRLPSPYHLSFTTANLIRGTSPADGSTGHPVNNVIYVYFNAYLDTASIPGSFSLADSLGNDRPAGFLYYRQSPNTFIIDPVSDLAPGMWYTVTLSTSIRSRGGASLPAPYVFSFRTAP